MGASLPAPWSAGGDLVESDRPAVTAWPAAVGPWDVAVVTSVAATGWMWATSIAEPTLRHRTWRVLPHLVVAITLVVGCAGDPDVEAGDGDAADGSTAGGSGGDDDSEDEGAEQVRIPADGLELEGVLRLPLGEGPHPTVVIVHGSGPQSADGAAPGQLGLTLPQPVPVYRELAVGLQERGFGVLTYDKRTCGTFNRCADNGYPQPASDVTVDDFVDDLTAVVTWARDDARIGPLVVLGHSQGGTIAASVAEDLEPDATILVATPHAPIDELLAEQAETFAELVDAAGQGGAAADQQIGELERLATDVASLRSLASDAAGGDIGGASAAFWRSWLALSDEAPARLAAADTPVLVLGGGRDWNVPTSDVLRWEQELGADAAVEIIDGVTHALTRLDVADPAAITPADVGGGVDERVVDRIASWLGEVVER